MRLPMTSWLLLADLLSPHAIGVERDVVRGKEEPFMGNEHVFTPVVLYVSSCNNSLDAC